MKLLVHSNLILTLLIKVLVLINGDTCSAYTYIRTATTRTVGGVVPWPKSVNYTHAQDYLTIEPSNFLIALDDKATNCPIIVRTAERYLREYLFDDVAPLTRDQPPSGGKSVGSLRRLIIRTAGEFVCDEIPSSEMIEAYSLRVAVATKGESWARLTSNSNWGIARGMETLSQLIYNQGPGRYAIHPVEIVDEPRFKYRGLMLDTARHYLGLNHILKTLDAMSFNKLNVFHWHMVDDQSFPFVSSKYPNISAQTSFRPGMVYTAEQVRFVVRYAAERGIRVLPELDTPGHTYALRVIKDVLTQCYDLKSKAPNGDLGPLDATRPESVRVASNLIAELASLFPDNYFHAGGDEVDFSCWQSNPKINQWMESRNMSGDFRKLNNYYLSQIYVVLRHHNRTMMAWQEVFDNGAKLPQDTVIQVWKQAGLDHSSELKKVVQAGYRAILSSCWYLNYIGYGQDWVNFYRCDPLEDPAVEKRSQLVLGGEACMWSEFVDESNVIARTWPRASAVAERLWSPKVVNNTENFLHRLEQMRCRLRLRNIQAEPVNGPGYC